MPTIVMCNNTNHRVKKLLSNGIHLLLIMALSVSLILTACSSKSDDEEAGTPQPTETAPATTDQTITPEDNQISDEPAEGVEGEYVTPLNQLYFDIPCWIPH